MSYSVFAKNDVGFLSKKLFFDQAVDIARYDQQKYPFLWKLTEKQLSFFWRPDEINLVKDQRDFRALSGQEQHIFTANLKRQILLDSVQGRSPSIAFLPIVSNSELETWVQTWAFSETIHSQSYTHIIRNVYSDPSEVFDQITDIGQIIDCAKDISACYDQLIECNVLSQAPQSEYTVSPYHHKRALWLTLMSVNILEGVRFYVSFACSWAFAEIKKMEGNAKIIKLICKDENLHLAGTQQLLRVLPKDDPDFGKIAEECKREAEQMFVSAVEQEKAWAEFLFKDGSMIGLTQQLLSDYIEFIANKRMIAVGLDSPYRHQTANPLPWTTKWIAGSEVQVAPQETEITSYQVGNINNDVDQNTFKGFEL